MVDWFERWIPWTDVKIVIASRAAKRGNWLPYAIFEEDLSRIHYECVGMIKISD